MVDEGTRGMVDDAEKRANWGEMSDVSTSVE